LALSTAIATTSDGLGTGIPKPNREEQDRELGQERDDLEDRDAQWWPHRRKEANLVTDDVASGSSAPSSSRMPTTTRRISSRLLRAGVIASMSTSSASSLAPAASPSAANLPRTFPRISRASSLCPRPWTIRASRMAASACPRLQVQGRAERLFIALLSEQLCFGWED
jgi:hypothetical protein